MPEVSMDVGAVQVPATDKIIVFGGYADNISSRAWTYFTEDNGRFEELHGLCTADFFPTNGCQISADKRLIFCGQQSYHVYDMESSKFTSYK